ARSVGGLARPAGEARLSCPGRRAPLSLRSAPLACALRQRNHRGCVVMDDPSARPPETTARAPGTPRQDGSRARRDEAALALGLRDDSPGTRPASAPGTAPPWLTDTRAHYPRELCVAQLVEAQ